ncbi:MAG: hypothetical protein LUQ07_05775 [Methanospirillum sp.]|nr:hypothetical protein [Methanospirillum sp.]
MAPANIRLDHIAIQVTSLERSTRFYQDILHIRFFGPVCPGDLSVTGRLFGKAVSGQGLFKGVIGGLSSRAIQNHYSRIALGSTHDDRYDLLLVEQRYPKTDATKSVDGNTIFGFSCSLSPAVDMEILGWDLDSAGVSFRYGDPGLDGSIYTPGRSDHSIYLRDPDGRTIELKTGQVNQAETEFILSIDTVTLHTTCPDTSKQFYTGKPGLEPGTDSQNQIPGKRFVWINNGSGEKILLLYGQTSADGNPIVSGGYGLDHIALQGLSEEGEADTTATDILMNPEKLEQKTGSRYIRDSDGFWIECCR